MSTLGGHLRNSKSWMQLGMNKQAHKRHAVRKERLVKQVVAIDSGTVGPRGMTLSATTRAYLGFIRCGTLRKWHVHCATLDTNTLQTLLKLTEYHSVFLNTFINQIRNHRIILSASVYTIFSEGHSLVASSGYGNS